MNPLDAIRFAQTSALLRDSGTALGPGEENRYQAWKATLPQNLQYEGDYDLRGFYRKNPTFSVNTPGQHMTDEFKLPNHPTFSNESSRYNAQSKHLGGRWNGDVFVPNDPNFKRGVDESAPGGSMIGFLAEMAARQAGNQQLENQVRAQGPGGPRPGIPQPYWATAKSVPPMPFRPPGQQGPQPPGAPQGSPYDRMIAQAAPQQGMGQAPQRPQPPGGGMMQQFAQMQQMQKQRQALSQQYAGTPIQWSQPQQKPPGPGGPPPMGGR